MVQTEAERFLNSLINYEKIPSYNYNLKDFERFLENFDSPHRKLKNVILIAGTKGKGSIAAILNSCLMESGFCVGLFTSPHLERINERIKFNNQDITNQDLKRYIKIIRPYIKRADAARTFFEVLTTIAFLYFLEKNVDYTILEVGLGGRLDATNVSRPIISVISKIGYDHTHLLGKKLGRIAREKAGIIKKNGTVVTIHQRPSVEKVIRSVVKKRRGILIYAEKLHKIKIRKAAIGGTYLRINGILGKFDTHLPLAGTHQTENLLIALAVIAELKRMGSGFDNHKIIKGIKKTRLSGRFQVISKKPEIIFDGAHNPDSFEALYHNIRLFRLKNFYLIFGCSRDKDIRFCVEHIFPLANRVYLVKIPLPRAMPPERIYRLARPYQKNIVIEKSVFTVLKKLVAETLDKTILITGSFYLWPDKFLK